MAYKAIFRYGYGRSTKHESVVFARVISFFPFQNYYLFYRSFFFSLLSLLFFFTSLINVFPPRGFSGYFLKGLNKVTFVFCIMCLYCLRSFKALHGAFPTFVIRGYQRRMFMSALLYRYAVQVVSVLSFPISEIHI